MPALEVTLPRCDDPTRARLASALTEAFCATTSHPKEIFGVVFREYDPGQCAMGGVLWTGEGPPYLHLVLFVGRLRLEAKRALARELSAAFTGALDQPSWVPVIHLSEHPYENVGVEGALLADTYCQGRPFYYDLGDPG